MVDATVSPMAGIRGRWLLPQWVWSVGGVRGAVAGILGGMAMGMFEMLATWSIAPDLLRPLELIGATHPLAAAHPAIVGAAMHIVTAAFWGTKLGVILGGVPRRLLTVPRTLMAGALWGVGVWVVMGKIVAPLLNAMIVHSPEPQFFVGHIVYGTVTAGVLAATLRSTSSPP